MRNLNSCVQWLSFKLSTLGVYHPSRIPLLLDYYSKRDSRSPEVSKLFYPRATQALTQGIGAGHLTYRDCFGVCYILPN